MYAEHRRTQDFTMEGGSRGGGPGQRVWAIPSGVQVQSPGRGSGERSPPEAEGKCEISVISNVFLYKILDLMKLRAGFGEYILQTHKTNFLKTQWGV